MPKKYYLVLDVGTTGIKAVVFNEALEETALVYKPLNKSLLNVNWVEQNPEELVSKSLASLREVIAKSGVSPSEVKSVGLATQRETVVAWDKFGGDPIYKAIVWEDKRGENYCENLKDKYENIIAEKTGLTLNAYFSASKINWLFENIPDFRRLLLSNALAVGTVDSWLLFNLLENQPFLTDCTNASRTLIFNIKSRKWDEELASIFGIPIEILPEVRPSVARFGLLKKEILGETVALKAVCGDQEASLYAAGSEKSTTKITYGTGTFIMQNIGDNFLLKPPFFTTLTAGKKNHYAVEGKIGEYGALIAKNLSGGKGIKDIVEEMVQKTAVFTNLLPLKPKEIIIDGGITQFEPLKEMQEKTSGISMRYQKTFNGTALGVAKLLSGKKS